jgi:hypothetical protein
MRDVVDQLERSLDYRVYFMSLFTALAVPDIAIGGIRSSCLSVSRISCSTAYPASTAVNTPKNDAAVD